MTEEGTHPAGWRLPVFEPAAAESLARATGLSPVTAGILLARGLSDSHRVREFLSPSLARDWVDPFKIAGMEQAAARVAAAVRARERIVVLGDFDVDGISSAALAQLGLAALGADVRSTVPNRFTEGYGLTEPMVERLIALAPHLVVTVDCGIASGPEVARLRSAGIDVVVTDHHEPGDAIPDGVPVCDPKLAPDGPELAGAGVALALVHAVGALLGEPDRWRELTDLAMLGTVADVVPLLGPNRALVADGLDRVRRGPRAGLAALAEVAGIPFGELTAHSVAFALAPRMNAAGRMGDPHLALTLLTTVDPREAEALAHALDEHNRLRQAAEADLMEAALRDAERVFVPGDRALVVAGEGWHEGVRGIVAARLVGRFGVPAIVLCVEDGVAQGSGRSVPGVDLFEAVGSLAPMLERFGGHAGAIGVTIAAAAIDAFRTGLLDSLASLPDSSFEKGVSVDAVVRLDDLSRELAAEIATLGPFGARNERPVLGSVGIFMNGRKRVGKDGAHLKFTAFDGAAAVPAISFRCPDIDALASTETAVDVAYEVDLDTWRGNERVQLLIRDIAARPRVPADGAAALVEELFERADEILARGEYAGIADADSFHTKLAGVTFENRQRAIARLEPGTPLRIVRESDNEFDPNAIALFDPFGDQVGYLNRRLAAALVGAIDAGVEYDVAVTETTGGGEGESLGVNVLVTRRDASYADAEAAELQRERRAELAGFAADALDAALIAHLIGDRAPHGAQSAALAHLRDGESTLLVMATGRGKSLVFHVHALREAIARGRASVFVYPLRALVADQAFHLEERFAELGCAVAILNGETPLGARDEAFTALADGGIDVVLTTPEFLEHHHARFADSGRIGFIAIDEAHHVGRARSGHRPAYGRLGEVVGRLGSPIVLAATATASTDVAAAIVETLGCARLVTDPTVRANLRVDDRRSSGEKLAYVASLAARKAKTIVYVNSRDVSVSLARQLRERVPELIHRVTFYNGGMNRASRHAVEHAFRDGDLTVVVATSAFGEGVDIPDVRHVVLYHMPFGAVEFNQMCGRCGRDGEPATVHLLFGTKDARLNRTILESAAPDRDELAALYVVLRRLANERVAIETTNAELAELVREVRPKTSLNDRGVSAGLGVFRELGLVASEGSGAYRRLVLLPAPGERLELVTSVRYAEGRDEIDEFESFREWVLTAPADELLEAFNRPILPKQPPAAVM